MKTVRDEDGTVVDEAVITTWKPTGALRWYGPIQQQSAWKLQQEWFSDHGESEWRDVPFESWGQGRG